MVLMGSEVMSIICSMWLHPIILSYIAMYMVFISEEYLILLACSYVINTSISMTLK